MSSAFDRIAAARAPSRAAAPAAPRSYATFAPATNPLSPAAQSGGAANPYHDPAHGSPSSRLLRETLMTAHEAQETAAAAALELNQQGEQLRATHGVVRDVGEAARGSCRARCCWRGCSRCSPASRGRARATAGR